MQLNNADAIELSIAHAVEDEDDLVRPLADYLRRAGVKVDYDEFTLTEDDKSINIGPARCGLVVISPHLVAMGWSDDELRGLAADDAVIIPILHHVTRDGLPSPLADRPVVTTDRGLADTAEAVLLALRPYLGQRLSLLRTALRGARPAPPQSSMPQVIDAEAHVVIRSMNIVNTMGRANSRIVGDLMTFLADLHRDLQPERELREWERMTAVFLVVDGTFELSAEERAELVSVLLVCSLGQFTVLDECTLPDNVVALVSEKWMVVGDIIRNERVRLSTKKLDETGEEAVQ